METAKNGLRDF